MKIRTTNYNQLPNGEKFLPGRGGMVCSALTQLELPGRFMLCFDMELFRLCSADTRRAGKTDTPEIY